MNENKNNSGVFTFILFANFLFCAALIPLIFEVIQQKYTSNIPYLSISFLLIAYIILFIISVMRKYLMHCVIYFIGIVCALIVLSLKSNYDKNKVFVQKTMNPWMMTAEQKEQMKQKLVETKDTKKQSVQQTTQQTTTSS